jgi:excisionase family DNA binding protein
MTIQARSMARIYQPPVNQKAVQVVDDFLAKHRSGLELRSTDGESVKLPPALVAVLDDATQTFASELGVAVSEVTSWLTTAEAADLIRVSRPTLIRLLEDGEIPFEQPRKHRLVKLADVLEFQARKLEAKPKPATPAPKAVPKPKAEKPTRPDYHPKRGI